MRRLPLTVQTAYADLVQQIGLLPERPGSISRRRVKGESYLYSTERYGKARHQRYLGRANDREAQALAARIERANDQARHLKDAVTWLRRSGLTGPPAEVAHVLEAVAIAGLFEMGMVLVGTAAYQAFPPIVGAILDRNQLMTRDIDFAVAQVAAPSSIRGAPFEGTLKQADPSFEGRMTVWDRSPWRFVSADGLIVEVLTRFGRRMQEGRSIAIPGLQCAAMPLRYMEYLIEDPLAAAALYRHGVPIKVPQPARYAVHKLIIAQSRKDREKRGKDLRQAAELIEVLKASDPHAIQDAIENARSRGTSWRQAIDRSLVEARITADN